MQAAFLLEQSGRSREQRVPVPSSTQPHAFPPLDRDQSSSAAPGVLGSNAGALVRTEHRTKTELALEAIRNAIMAGRVKPGARLTLAELSDVLAMSITPIREAIRVLEADG